MIEETIELDRQNAQDAIRGSEREDDEDHRDSIYWSIRDSGNNVEVIAMALINALSTDELSQVINRINKKLEQ